MRCFTPQATPVAGPSKKRAYELPRRSGEGRFRQVSVTFPPPCPKHPILLKKWADSAGYG